MKNLICFLTFYCSLSFFSFGQSLSYHFMENKGQWETDILFQSTLPTYKIDFKSTSAQFNIQKKINDTSYQTYSFELSVLNTNSECNIKAEGGSEYYSNFLKGKDPNKYATYVRDFNKIKYQNIYEDIDLVYYLKDNNLKYDFIVGPHADWQNIQLSYKGINKLEIDDTGNLVVYTKVGEFTEMKPYTYQLINGIEVQVNCEFYLLNDSTFTFSFTKGVNPNYSIVIDPVVLSWCTFVGGQNGQESLTLDLASDNLGYVYGSGETGLNFPTTVGVVQTFFASDLLVYNDGFIYKLSPDGTTLVWATYVGGDNSDYVGDIELNDEYQIFATGVSFSSDFPVTTMAYDTSYDNTGSYVFRLNSTGTDFIYSTRYGGSSTTKTQGIAIDGNNRAYVTGSTNDNYLDVTPNAYDTTLYSSSYPVDAFVAVFNEDGSNLEFATYFGGSRLEIGRTIKIASDGTIFVHGITLSSDLPMLPSSYDSIYDLDIDVFIAKFSNDLSELLACTYFGGNDFDIEFQEHDLADMDIDALDRPIIVGGTNSTNLPLVNALNSTTPINAKGYFAKFSSNLDSLIFCSYFGEDICLIRSVEITETGDFWITGNTKTNGFYQSPDSFLNPNIPLNHKLFLSKISKDGTQILFSTLFGGSEISTGNALCLDKDFEVVCGSITDALDLPTTPGVFGPNYNGLNGHSQPFAFKVIDSTSLANNHIFSFPNASIQINQPLVQINCKIEQGIYINLSNIGNGLISSVDFSIFINGLYINSINIDSIIQEGNQINNILISNYVFNFEEEYEILITIDSVNGMLNKFPSSDTISFLIPEIFNLSIVDIERSCQNTSSTCQNDLLFQINGGIFPYEIKANDSTFFVENNQFNLSNICGENVTIHIKDLMGCEDSVQLSIPSESMSYTYSLQKDNCSNCGNSLEFDILNEYGYVEISLLTELGDTLNEFSNLCEGVYSIFINDESGCFIADSILIDCNNTFYVYPNPTYNTLFFSGLSTSGAKIQLYSSIGQLIDQRETVQAIYTLDTSYLAKGVYIYRVIMDDKEYIGKVVKL